MHSKDMQTKVESVDTFFVFAVNDSAAFIEATEKLWRHKATNIYNLKRNGIMHVLPFYFFLEDEDGLPVHFDSTAAIKTIRYYRDTLIPSYDSINEKK